MEGSVYYNGIQSMNLQERAQVRSRIVYYEYGGWWVGFGSNSRVARSGDRWPSSIVICEWLCNFGLNIRTLAAWRSLVDRALISVNIARSNYFLTMTIDRLAELWTLAIATGLKNPTSVQIPWCNRTVRYRPSFSDISGSNFGRAVRTKSVAFAFFAQKFG